MCILCENETLELLTTSTEGFQPGQLAEAVRTARDAAAPGVMDHAEAVLRGEVPARVGAEIYAEVVVGRALEAGVLTSAAAVQWEEQLREDHGLHDPRVQAFVSSCAEIVDDYLLLLTERKQLVERFVEARGASVSFSWLGRDGELWFEYGGEMYAALSESEALEIVERELSSSLHTLEPETLLRYTTLPDTGLEVLAGILTRPAEAADALLAGMVDIHALADDRVRNVGFAPFFQGEQQRSVEDLRFGSWVVIRIAAE